MTKKNKAVHCLYKKCYVRIIAIYLHMQSRCTNIEGRVANVVATAGFCRYCKHDKRENSQVTFCQRESTPEPKVRRQATVTKIRLYRSKTRSHSSRMPSDVGHKSGNLRRLARTTNSEHTFSPWSAHQRVGIL